MIRPIFLSLQQNLPILQARCPADQADEKGAGRRENFAASRPAGISASAEQAAYAAGQRT